MAVIRQMSTSRPSVKFPDLWISFPQRQNHRVLSPGTADRFPMRKDDDVGKQRNDRPNCNLCLRQDHVSLINYEIRTFEYLMPTDDSK